LQVIECNFCGETVSGANDDDLARNLSRHLEEQHADAGVTEDQVRGMIERESYQATDS
jgi:predicted small metal-binding protein